MTEVVPPRQRRQDALATAGETPALRVWVKPFQNAGFEFFWGGADGSAVVGAGDFPELRVGIVGVDEAGVAGSRPALISDLQELPEGNRGRVHDNGSRFVE